MNHQEQYKFVYDTLEEHIKCGKTWFPVAELSERLKSKARKDPVNKMNEYQKEYAQICKQTPRYITLPALKILFTFSAHSIHILTTRKLIKPFTFSQFSVPHTPYRVPLDEIR